RTDQIGRWRCDVYLATSGASNGRALEQRAHGEGPRWACGLARAALRVVASSARCNGTARIRRSKSGPTQHLTKVHTYFMLVCGGAQVGRRHAGPHAKEVTMAGCGVRWMEVLAHGFLLLRGELALTLLL